MKKWSRIEPQISIVVGDGQGRERGWCNLIDEGGGAATDAVAYLTVGDVLTVQLSSFLATKIKDAKTINFICSSTIKVLVERCCQAW